MDAQIQRSLEHFSIGKDLIPREMITAYAILKKAAANANHASKRLDDQRHKLIVEVCDEILGGQHHDMFPLDVWMTGSGTQIKVNVNQVISDRCCQLAGTPISICRSWIAALGCSAIGFFPHDRFVKP
jgi:fumarate hydratase class II